MALLVGLSACGPATLPPGDVVVDAGEAQNRAVHRFNVALDRAVVAPVAGTYGAVVPPPVRTGIRNAASNLSQPGYVLNNLVQVRVGDALQNTLRFAINTTVGIGGLLDPATALGLPAAETDFGETLHIYGLGEGDYHVLPVLGPSTVRDSVGRLVDFATNPLRHAVPLPERYYLTGTRVLAGLGARHAASATLEGIYAAEDSYAAVRSLYLQNRRFELRGDDGGALFDPYADPAATPGVAAGDPVLDPYFDPYAQ